MPSSKLVIACSLLLLNACAMKAQPYQIQYQNQQTLNGLKIESNSITLTGFLQPDEFSSMCRLTAPLALPEGQDFGAYLRTAFIKELQSARLYADKDPKLTLNAKIIDLGFSSSDNILGGSWKFSILFTSSNGKSTLVEDTYRFSSGFDGITACSNTANAYGPAVGQLIGKAFSSLEFNQLLR